ncbi:MAG TPA: hypothetical protein VFX39_05340 [Gemmatimonadaceae bacterium]|nr:hypothetical protein [Gemmatimonadaceae bacterium]
MTQRSSLQLLVGAVSLLLVAACARATTGGPGAAAGPAGPPATARDLVERMRAQHADSFYRTLTFRQENTTYTSAGEQASAWFERQVVPGLLRIDFVEPVADGSGILFRNDSAYTFQHGELAQSVPQLHPLLLLAADVYAIPVDTTMDKLARLGLDTTVVRGDTWNARPVWVVGAPAGDTTSTQFWVDAERMLLVRLFHRQPAPGGRPPRTTEYQFEYQDVQGFPVPRQILFLRDGKPFFRETYVDPRPNAPVDDSVFVPTRWAGTVPQG